MEAHTFKSIRTTPEFIVYFHEGRFFGYGMTEEDIEAEPVLDNESVNLVRPSGSDPPIFYMYSCLFTHCSGLDFEAQ
jgi:hypothetical protein